MGLAEEMTDIYIDLVHRTDLMSKKYWKLVKALAMIEKERDEFREKFKEEEMKNRSMKISFELYGDTAKGMLDEERKLRENVEKERDELLYDRNYYRNELDKEIELGTDVEFQKDFLMNKFTGCKIVRVVKFAKIKKLLIF